jgi:pimeloyl-ACP methyl ester carboxylesterase
MPASPKPFFIDRDGQRIALLQLGQGPEVMLLHGFPDTAWSFLPVMRHLADAGYRATAVFLRGYAPSSLAPDDDYRVDALAADVLGVIDALDAPRAAVVGHDWGAVAAYATAQRAPERISALVTAAVPHLRRFLAALGPRQLWRSRYMLRYQLPGAPARFARGDALERLVAEWSPGWSFTAEDLAPVRESLREPARARALLRYYRLLPGQLVHTPTRRRLLAPVPVAATIVSGAQDGCIGAENFRGQEPLFPAGLQLERMADAGHFMHCERPEAFARIVMAALARAAL